MNKSTVAFLGLGTMGAGMAARLQANGFPLTVYNRTREKAEKIGAKVADTPRHAASGAQVIISMVADDNAARALWLGNDGALAGAAPGTVLIESSTITVDWARELAKSAQQRGCHFLDAPVTGSKNHAAAGELVFLVGGDAKTLDSVRPVLQAMSRQIVHVGPAGSGALMKLINNAVCGVQAVALAEAMAIIEKSSLDREKAVEVLTGGAPGSPLVKMISARMMANDYTPNFTLRLIAKDLRYALQQCGSFTSMDVVAAALQTFERGIAAGLGDKDFASVVEVARNSRKDKA